MPELDLSALRYIRRMSQQELADKMEVKQATLSHWERGLRSIPLDEAAKIARILTEETPTTPVTLEDIYQAWEVSKKHPRRRQRKNKPEENPPDPAIAA
jgi:transcriptional regulator with XRE-family HTH domain